MPLSHILFLTLQFTFSCLSFQTLLYLQFFLYLFVFCLISMYWLKCYSKQSIFAFLSEIFPFLYIITFFSFIQRRCFNISFRMSLILLNYFILFFPGEFLFLFFNLSFLFQVIILLGRVFRLQGFFFHLFEYIMSFPLACKFLQRNKSQSQVDSHVQNSFSCCLQNSLYHFHFNYNKPWWVSI